MNALNSMGSSSPVGAPVGGAPVGGAPAGGGPVTAARGVVVTPDGWPVRGARITVIDLSGGQLGAAVAESDGTFVLDRLVPGPATLLVAAPGHEPRAHSVSIPATPQWELGSLQLGRTGAARLPESGIWVIDPDHSAITAQARHLGLASVRGGFTKFGGVIVVRDRFEESTAQVMIDAASIATNNATRDEHLRSADFLDVVRHPQLGYVGDRVERVGDDWVVVGSLTMLGMTRPVNLSMTYQGSGPDPWGGTRAGFSATTVLRRDDFAMNWNLAVGLGIDALGTTLRVDIELEAVRQAG